MLPTSHPKKTTQGQHAEGPAEDHSVHGSNKTLKSSDLQNA